MFRSFLARNGSRAMGVSVTGGASSAGRNGVRSASTLLAGRRLMKVAATPATATMTASSFPSLSITNSSIQRSFHASPVPQAKMTVEQLANTVDLKDSPVLVRVDLNVPLDKDNNVTDDTRLRAVVPTTKYLLDKGAKVILCSHFGRPKGEIIETGKNGRLTPVREPLETLLGVPVTKVNDCMGPEVEQAVANLKSGEVLLLENTRFYKGETKNDPELAQGLARLAPYFVMDAFGTAHRAHSSTAGVCEFTKYNAAGYLMEKELKFLVGAVDEHPQRPLMAIVGGAKVSTKIPVIESLLNNCDTVLLGGGMIFTFYKALGYETGNSLVEDDMVPLADKLMKLAEEKGVKLVLPTDVVLADAFDNEANTAIAAVTDMGDGDWRGLDIGPETIETFQKEIDQANTIVWNGPSTYYSNCEFVVNKGIVGL